MVLEGHRQQGLALVEVTIVLPVLLLLLAAIVDFGRIFYEGAQLQGRINGAVRYLAMHAVAGECQETPGGGTTNVCDIAENLVLYASPKQSGSPADRVGGVITRAYQEDDSHWQVSATYTPDFIFSGFLPDTVDGLTISPSAIQRSLLGPADKEDRS